MQSRTTLGVNTIEFESFPAPRHRLIPIFAHLRIDVYRRYSGCTDEDAARMGTFLVILLCDSSGHVTDSGGWMEILKLVDAVNKAGYDRAWARAPRRLRWMRPPTVDGSSLRAETRR